MLVPSKLFSRLRGSQRSKPSTWRIIGKTMIGNPQMSYLTRDHERDEGGSQTSRMTKTLTRGVGPFWPVTIVVLGGPNAMDNGQHVHSVRLESEIVTIKERLGNIEHLLSARVRQPDATREIQAHPSPDTVHTSTPGVPASVAANFQSPSVPEPPGFPTMVIRNKMFMRLVGLDHDLALHLARLERSGDRKHRHEIGRHFFLQQHVALNLLGNFFEEIHPWYPLLDSEYQGEYIAVMDGPLTPSSESCLALIVAALGALSSPDAPGKHVMYAELALSMVSSVLVDCCVQAVEALVYIAVYYCCLCSPLDAFEYIAIASLKNASELAVQFELIDTGVWNLDGSTPLPSVREIRTCSPQSPFHVSPNTLASPLRQENNQEDADAYFLAEIAMRRISHRCPTAVRVTADGKQVYAPIVASELRHQLEEWFKYLPPALKFHRDNDVELQDTSGLVLFLRTQYYSCMTSIYWPAVYQIIETGKWEYDLHIGCQKFFEAYSMFLKSVTLCVQHCAVNKWTLLARLVNDTLRTPRRSDSILILF
ncbi:hypothetical protein LTR10_021845 [Elasticomyces elasticus]|uniref:Uncharacterized protein n=1 Tax=Exophiala sideris TaxID=1016849 RepID=A0ABR0JFC6_9EURO|nr:hypothetical protein LTR10_021845 [Elasticomyces elasticus]KAK5025277.1 hypothetical protein LTS07_008128 [Exophiala sideris]KAK5029174.1 hypothetical protein LTR13_008711 [Exophiala sideris]KAK5063337.1 hypothetical protein LTR69_004043 [Exophiala sideris]KAK5179052.1 hypothetical protein LTR44_008541 [Eurotiomycetes sp. CCFEE 6388]